MRSRKLPSLSNPEAQRQLAHAASLHQQGQINSAIPLYDTILKEIPRHFIALHLRGLASIQSGSLEEGINFIRKSLRIEPNFPEAQNNLGNALRECGNYSESLIAFNRAIALRPDFAEAYSNKGNLLQELGRWDDAIANYRKAIDLRPDFVDALVNCSSALLRSDKPEEALAICNRVVSLQPGQAYAHMNRGKALLALREPERALAAFDHVLTLTPESSAAYAARGEALKELGRSDEAIVALGRAIAAEPSNSEFHYNLGIVLADVGRHEEAIAAFDQAILRNGSYANALFSKALSCLALGRFEEGWHLYEWRKRTKDPVGNRVCRGEQWSGKEDLAGRRLFLYAEQGLGDTIQFIRYAQLIASRGAAVTVSVQDALVPLLRNLEPAVSIIGETEEPALYDFHCPLMSLPGALGTTLATIPAQVPYLRPDADRVARWRQRLGTEGFRIGICWQGSTGRIDLGRSFPVTAFAPVARIPGVRLVSLHKGAGEVQLAQLPLGMEVETLGEDFDPPGAAFLDSAAIMANCHLVITSDTAIAHLAGALGVPTWLLVRRYAEPRWLFGRNDTPWYPSMRLFRQSQEGDWPEVFVAVEAELRALLASRDHSSVNTAPAPDVTGSGADDLLIPSSFGELLDKITILEIKRERITSACALTNVSRELDALEAVAVRHRAVLGPALHLKSILRAVNERLWDVEDALREKERAQDFDAAFVSLAREVYVNNDERSRIKRTINELTSSKFVEEKHYKAY